MTGIHKKESFWMLDVWNWREQNQRIAWQKKTIEAQTGVDNNPRILLSSSHSFRVISFYGFWDMKM